MKTTLLILLFTLGLFSFAQQVENKVIEQGENKFYFLKQEGSNKLLIFLHGGVTNPKVLDTTIPPSIDFLLEGNKLFITEAQKNGFDVFIPIANDSLNWLSNHAYCFNFLKGFSKEYNSTYISGFSDGGTGSYKIFYDYSSYFNGLAVFNGYPQHKNFNLKVDYSAAHNKPIAYFSTFKDQVIPYEFLLTEYCKQKEFNANTFLLVRAGGHSFGAYKAEDLRTCFDILQSKITNTKKEALHGYVKQDSLVEFYPFRKKVVKKFGYGEEYYQLNKIQEEH